MGITRIYEYVPPLIIDLPAPLGMVTTKRICFPTEKQQFLEFQLQITAVTNLSKILHNFLSLPVIPLVIITCNYFHNTIISCVLSYILR